MKLKSPDVWNVLEELLGMVKEGEGKDDKEGEGKEGKEDKQQPAQTPAQPPPQGS
jgi:hypothetical protein